MTSPFYICSCYFTHNIYIKRINKHLIYLSKEQFFRDYEAVLNQLECSENNKELLIKEINLEVSRRKALYEKLPSRRKLIADNYTPYDINVFKLEEHFLDPAFIKLVDTAKCSNYCETIQLIEKLSIEKKLYGFPVFKPEFCQRLLAELEHFEKSNAPKERPNTMNNYGVLIDDLGFHDKFSLPLREKYLNPLAKLLFPEWTLLGLDSHKIFTVGYQFGEDAELGYHYDNSEVTLNVCLGKEFEGGNLYFGDMKAVPVSESTCISTPHRVGYGIFHRGQQYHGALPITSGERQNLIIWLRSSSVRNSLCPMCNSKPSLIASEDNGDGFTLPQHMSCDLI